MAASNTRTPDQFLPLLSNMAWSKEVPIDTKHGKKLVKRALIEDRGFWTLWKQKGGALKECGYSVRKNQESKWEITRWRDPDPADLPEEEAFEAPEPIAAPIDIDVPQAIVERLLPFQVDPVKWLVRAIQKHNGALDGSSLGSGKTYMGTAAAKMLGLRPLIVCPIAVMPNWRRVSTIFGVNPVGIINYEMLKTGKTPYGYWTFTKKGDKKRFFWTLPERTMLVYDEIQKCKTASSQNAKIAASGINQGIKILGISGTIASNPTEMRVSGHIAKLHSGGDFYQFMMQNGVVKTSSGFMFTGSRAILKRIHHQIFPEHGVRIRTEDIPDFPETSIRAEAFSFGENTQKIAEAYRLMLEHIAQIEVDDTIEPSSRKASQLAAMMAARRAAERLKVPTLCEMIEDYIEEGRSIVVFTNFNETVDVLQKIMKTDCVVRGGQRPEVRERNIQRFQSDEERLIIVNIQSGGAGLSLHDLNGLFPRRAVIFPTWSAMDLKQATGRVHRAGAKSKSDQIVMFAAGTIEDDICDKVREKLKNIDSINDGMLHPPGTF